tara:strand:- start:1721 stop:2416 length:696 start_codon:yes stop_codon:yes gene_type:complete
MNLNLNKIKYDDFMSSIKDQKIYEVKKKRERAVYFVPDMKIFYKVWVRDWTQSEITSFGVASGFYNEENASSLISLLYDDSGPRGYVQHAGESAVGRGKSDKCWDYFVSKTSRNQRLLFMKNILSSSILARGTYTDLAPCNIIFYNDKINFIDFESFRSFSLLFESKKEKYEKFDLSAWWNPLETARRDVNRYISNYFEKCLDVKLQFNIDSEENFNRAFDKLKSEKCHDE